MYMSTDRGRAARYSRRVLLCLASLLMVAATWCCAGDTIILESFEGDSELDWQWSVNDARAEIVTEGAKDGAKCLKMTFGSKEGGQGLVQSCGPLAKDVVDFEKFTFWAKGDGTDHAFKVYLVQLEGDKTYTYESTSTYSFLDIVWHRIEIQKRDFVQCFWSQNGSGKLDTSKVTHIQFVNVKSAIPEGGCTVWIDGICLEGASPAVLGKNVSNDAVTTSVATADSPAQEDTGAIYVKPAAISPASRFLVNDFDDSGLSFNSYAKTSYAIDQNAGKDGNGLSITFDGDGAVQFFVKNESTKWAEAGCESVSFDYRGDGAPETYFLVSLKSTQREWIWRGPAWNPKAKINGDVTDWKHVTLNFADFWHAWKKEREPGKQLRVEEISTLQIRSGKGKIWIDNIVVAPAGDSSALPLVRPAKSSAVAPSAEKNVAAVAWRSIDQSTIPLKVHGDARLCAILNGVWDFKPLKADEELDYTKSVDIPTVESWDKILVPSHWDNFHEFAYPRSWADLHQAWYRRSFVIPEEFRNKRIHLRFSAVAYRAQVFLNGKRIGEHNGAWVPFELDATAAAKVGEANELVVFVADLKSVLVGDYDLAAIAGWGYSTYHKIAGTSIAWTIGECPKRRGIWQDVFLIGVDPVHVRDAFVNTSFRNGSIDATVEVKNESAQPRMVTVSGKVHPSLSAPERASWSYEATKPGPEAVLSFDTQAVTLAPGEVKVLSFAKEWKNPRLWEPDDPALHYLKLDVKGEGNADISETRFGFREVWVEGSELILNGKPTHIVGNTAHSAHALSLVCNRAYWEAYLGVLKNELNFNGTRLMSEVPYPIMPTVCDEMGFLVIEQSSNWASPGYNINYLRAGDEFLNNLEIEYSEWIRRDRNHPSIVVWSLQNEGSDHERFLYQLKKMREVVLTHDATRPIQYCGLGKTEGLADVSAIHYGWYKAAKTWEKDIPLGCVEELNKKICVADAALAWNKDPGYKGSIYRELLFSQSYQRMHEFYAILNFALARPVGFLKSTFRGRKEEPLVWDEKVELYPKPDHSTTWCWGGAVVNIWDKTRPVYELVPETSAAFRKAYSPLFAGILDEIHDFASGQTLQTEIHVLNDTRQKQDIEMKAFLETGAAPIELVSSALELGAGKKTSLPLTITFPAVDTYCVARLRIVLNQAGKQVFDIDYPLDLYPASHLTAPKFAKPFALLDTTGETTKILNAIGVSHVPGDLEKLDPKVPLLVGKDSDRSSLVAAKDAIAGYVKAGGRIVVFEQQEGLDKWLPINIPACYAAGASYGEDAAMNGKEMASVDAPDHPLFEGLPDVSLFHWEAGNVGLVAGSRGLFRPYEFTISGNYRSLVSTSANMRFDDCRVAELMELPWGRGTVLLSQLELHANYGKNPVATKLLYNLLAYAASEGPLLEKQDRFLFIGAEASRRAAKRGCQVPTAEVIPADLSRRLAIFIGPDVYNSLADEWPKLKAFVESGGIALIELPARAVELAWLRPGLRTAEDNNFLERVKSAARGADKEWWGEGDKPIIIHNRRTFLQGVASGDLLPAPDSIENLPLLEGLGASDISLCAPAVMAAIPLGKGQIVLSTLPILTADGYRARLLWHTLLTNLRVPLPIVEPEAMAFTGRENAPVYKVIKAGEVEIDGDLQEWTFIKGEDGALNNWRNAEPIVITAKDVSDEQVKSINGDKDKSAIAFLMWDEKYLYFGAKIIDDFVYDKGGNYGGDAVELCLGEIKFTFDIDGDGFNFSGGESAGVRIPQEKIKYAIKRVEKLGGSRRTELITAKSGESITGAPGYVIEMGLPFDYLPMIFPLKPGTRFGFGLALNDNDNGERQAQIAWPSGWKWNMPSTWATAELGTAE